ncbi:Flp family type IVb pilin [Variovorax boronicumulans]|uniref:Flp family type IVb pilin n=1 Tax=Variovorax boronicumulans TaxID=436515 RepID=A0A250DMK5_9BURK|nr:Flp family type IVb pilin [Variovorax boronicumulans]ATA55484.1 Flp family type IVb pilin [Variovorax boronicumulans]
MFKSLLTDEGGAQVVEYALIIAIISIVLVIALQPATIAASIDTVLTRVADCLAGNGCA